MIYLLSLLILLTGCAPSFPGENELRHVSNSVTKRNIQENHLIPFGTGASWPDKCHAVEYAYLYGSTTTISEARRLLLDAAQVIFESVIEVKDFEQYLLNPPFTTEHIMLSVMFESPNYTKGDNPQIKHASLFFGTLRYRIKNEENHQYVLLLEETYEEALERRNL